MAESRPNTLFFRAILSRCVGCIHEESPAMNRRVHVSAFHICYENVPGFTVTVLSNVFSRSASCSSKNTHSRQVLESFLIAINSYFTILNPNVKQQVSPCIFYENRFDLSNNKIIFMVLCFARILASSTLILIISGQPSIKLMWGHVDAIRNYARL